ncbi:MAG: hypothetical protein OXH38_04610 [Chloroflexi bacterium]|nr:hypothetical protein [Chloroflexota bacterium]
MPKPAPKRSAAIRYSADASKVSVAALVMLAAVLAVATQVGAQASETPKITNTSEGFYVSYLTLRDHAFTVSGGEVINARRLVHRKNLRWEITISPTSDATVTVELPATSDCTATGAICTTDQRMLTTVPALVVSGPGQP